MTKKVKFDSLNYYEEIIENTIEVDSEIINDLDLDTIKASKNKAKGLKEFDSEGSEEEVDELIVNQVLIEEEDSIEDSNEMNDFNSNSDSEDFDERNEILIEPFSLRQDREEGTFDYDGFYIRNQDEDADQDRWMSNFTRSDILKARRAHEEREKQRLKDEENKQKSTSNARVLYEELVGMLADEDDDLTVQEVISRLNKPKESTTSTASIGRAPPLNKNRLKKLIKEQEQINANNTTNNNINTNTTTITITSMTSENKVKLDRITEIVDTLMDLGNFGVYEESRREILSKLK